MFISSLLDLRPSQDNCLKDNDASFKWTGSLKPGFHTLLSPLDIPDSNSNKYLISNISSVLSSTPLTRVLSFYHNGQKEQLRGSLSCNLTHYRQNLEIPFFFLLQTFTPQADKSKCHPSSTSNCRVLILISKFRAAVLPRGHNHHLS